MLDHALTNCKRQGWEPYLPTFFNDRTKQRQPLFPGYLFVDCRGEWGPLASTMGISRVITFGEEAAVIPTAEIKRLKQAENRNGNVDLAKIEFNVGDEIEVVSGKLEGLTGTYGGIDDVGRIKFLYSLLGRASHTFVRQSHVARRS